jgi:CheY-like chemotaxis protein
VIATILRRAGHDVTVAENAAQALAAAAGMQDRLELLITDVVMPGMGGVELSRELRGRIPQLKVLLFSGYPGREDAGLGDAPALDYLAKPVTPQQLLERIDQLLGSSGST